MQAVQPLWLKQLPVIITQWVSALMPTPEGPSEAGLAMLHPDTVTLAMLARLLYIPRSLCIW